MNIILFEKKQTSVYCTPNSFLVVPQAKEVTLTNTYIHKVVFIQ